jgi:RNA-directed DNA polymerase
MVQVHHGEEVANHSGPESCGLHREVQFEALTGETGRPAIEPRNHLSDTPTLLGEAEGDAMSHAIASATSVSRGQETPSMPGSLLHRSWEISSVPASAGGMEKAEGHNAIIDVEEKSDAHIVPGKRTNEGGKPEEIVEGRCAVNGNALQSCTCRTQSRGNVSKGLQGVRERARQDRRIRFTALLHHVTPELLEESYYQLRKDAAVGVDGMTWHAYQVGLAERLVRLHEAIHKGTYRAQASRRVYIPKSDGKKRGLGIASLEDKIVQQAVVTVLNMIYEGDFLGFSYGFRAGRSQHDALNALWIALMSRPIEWILDADIQAFFDSIDHGWMMRFLEHRIGDRRLLRLIEKWLKAGVWEGGRSLAAEKGTPQGAVISPLLANIYLHYVFDQWAQQWRNRHDAGDVVVVRYADDNIVGFQHKASAEIFLEDLKERLRMFGLQLHPEKTRLLRFGRKASRDPGSPGNRESDSFDFLGFTHCMGTTHGGRYEVKRITIKKRMRATLKAIRAKLMKTRHLPIQQVGNWLKSVLHGYFNYFSVPGNRKQLDGFRSEVRRAWRRALMLRSQRGRMNWQRYLRLSRKYFPKVTLVHWVPWNRLPKFAS